MSKARILIVEDQPPAARMIALWLQKLGHEIVGTTAFAHEAVDLSERLRPDLVFMDIDLADGCSGVEAATLIRRNLAIPSVFLTGQTDRPTVQRAREAEPFGYLVKPFEEFELQTTLDTALKLRSAEMRLTQFSQAVEQSPASIVITDTTGRIEYVNPHFTELTGFTAAEAIGQNPRVLKSGHQPAEYYRNLWETITAGREWHGEFCNLKKNGDPYWELASISPIRDDAGRITHFVAVKEDITARKHADEVLQQSEARYRTLFENVGEGIGVVDLQERFLFANPAAGSIFGVPAGGLVGRSLREFTQPGQFEKVAEQTKRRAAGATDSYEIEIGRPDGEKRTLLVTAVPQRDQLGHFNSTFGVFRDITERKRAEEESLQSRIQLEDANAQLTAAVARERDLAIAADVANRTKSAFLASMSHELRTPLNVINGVAATLSDQLPDAGQRNALNLILESGQNLLGIIEEILDYSGLQAGHPRIESKPFDLLGVVAQVLRMAGEAAWRKQLDLSFSAASGVPAVVVTDQRRLQQVLLNLVNNAVKFTSHGRVHLHCYAQPLPAGQWKLSFTVSDTGDGITPAEVARLFQPFVRGTSPGVAQSSGSGLGLVNSRSYANLLGGDIVVRSRPGRGSVFRCTIMAGGTDSRVTALSAAAPTALRDRRALIVIDDHRQRRFLAAVARAWSLPATVCCGAEATTAALESAGPFTLAVIDHHAVREQSSPLSRWLAPGAPGHSVPVAWLQRSDAPLRPETSAPSLVLPHPLDLNELARALATLAAKSPPAPAAGLPPRHAKLGERIPLRILAADDIRTNREMLRMMMHHLGYKLALVENGAEVLDAMQKRTFDLVLLDIQMPVMDGHEAARQICRLHPDPARRPKLVAITANALPGDREKCLNAGMDDYLTKPVHPKTLEACFVRLFQSRPAAAPAVAAPSAPEPTTAPWLDRACLESVMAGFTPGQMAETLAELHAATCDDFLRIWPEVVNACANHDMLRLSELTHGLKGCFLTVGWMRIARRCIQVLGEARKGSFAGWEPFPAELKSLFDASNAAMSDYLAEVSRSATSATPSTVAAETNGHASPPPNGAEPWRPLAGVADPGAASARPATLPALSHAS